MLHLLLLAALGLDSRGSLETVPPRRTITTFIVTPSEDPRFAGLKPVQSNRDDWDLPNAASSTIRIGDLTIDLDKIRERAPVLFPFLTPGLSLEHFLPGPPDDGRPHLQNPLAAPSVRRPTQHNRALTMSDTALQSQVDMAWSRRDRWAAFEPIRQLALDHDADTGSLPKLLGMYCDQNALQPYVDSTTRDPRLWTQLGLAADHVSFIGFIRSYASDHPSSKGTTELLFLLDRIAVANRDALAVMLHSEPSEDLGWTQHTNLEAYRLLVRIRQHYQDELRRRSLDSDEAIDRYYDTARLAILDAIVRSTPNGYRADEARFLIGEIYWREKDTSNAVRSWREVKAVGAATESIGFRAIVDIARRLDATQRREGAQIDPPLGREIDRLLANEEGRWLSFSYDRLRHFGYRLDSF